jgi:hypothetical protein
MADEKPPLARHTEDDLAAIDEAPFIEVDLPPVSIEDRLDLYEIYREMGGAAFEPNESQFKANRAAHGHITARRAA